MCYDDTARPPYPPDGNGKKARGEDLVLTASDGNRFAAYIAYPADPGGPIMLIYPDAGGLHTFYKELTLRFAEIGITALAFDKFGRTAGLTERNEDFDWRTHAPQVKWQTFFDDATTALAYLRAEAGGEHATFTIGCCMGGALSLVSGARNLGLAGAIAFYASGMRPKREQEGGLSVLDVAEGITCPVLGLFGGADHVIPIEDVHELDERLDKAGVEHEIVIYPGAPHGFFEIEREEFAEMATDAWRRVLGFIKAHSAVA